MKIGIVTYFRRNYGAALQAYALQTVVNGLGHSSEILDFMAPARQIRTLFTLQLNAKKNVLRFFRLLQYQKFALRKHRFDNFENSCMHVSKQRYCSSKELEKIIVDYDGVICGSDQVWRPRKDKDRNRIYFLGFADKAKAKKISYAASFGVSSVPMSGVEHMKAWLNDISHLSVREETGRGIIEKITGRRAAVVLDPTFLIENSQWENIAEPVEMEPPYVLVYSTSQRGVFSELVKHIKMTTGLPVVVLSLYSLNLVPMADHVIYDAGPREFIQLFANAACVCTNSYHGAAFSIIFKKPFWSVPHNTTNARTADLLSRIYLKDRQVSERGKFPQAPLEIDYTKANTVLDKEKQNSKAYLHRALQE